MRIHYLEIVATDVDAVCSAYAAAGNFQFGEPEAELGNARTARVEEGYVVGVRAPMHEAEAPVVRPYWLVDDIESAVAAALEAGGELAHPPLEIPGRGMFAIYTLGGVHHGLWQL
ncbi:MAG: hydroxylase [Gammaproteobacteria bacterium]|nr:hydroxylase [Gammaproteobacteria bacterium]